MFQRFQHHLFSFSVRLVRQRGILAALTLIAFLQRSPVVRFLAEARFAAPSRVVQLMPWVTAATATMTGYHALAGATRDVSPASAAFPNPLTVEAGQEFVWAVKVELREDNADAWQLRSDSGPAIGNQLAISIIGNNLAQISGTLEVAGTYGIEVVAWEKANFSGTRSRPYFLTINVTEPPPPVDPLPAFFGDGYQKIDDTWSAVEWFGWMVTSRAPWVQTADHGWVYFALNESAGTNVWFFDLELGWCFTSRSSYPLIYIADEARWLEFKFGSWLNSSPPRWFLDFTPGNRTWIQVPAAN
jgi:hypothetical protein